MKFNRPSIPIQPLVLIALLTAFLSGCTVAPRPVYRSFPTQGAGIWNNGKELSVEEQDGLEMVAVSRSANRSGMNFTLEFRNLSDKSVTIDPAAFFFVPVFSQCDSIVIDLADSTVTRIPAFDPEAALLGHDLAQSRMTAIRQGQLETDALFGFLDLVAAFSSSSEDKTEEQQLKEAIEDQEETIRQENREQAHRARVQSMSESRYRWANKTLRKSTLLPGQMIGGNVQFPMSGFASRIIVVFPVGGRNMQAPFRIEKHVP